MKLIILDRDGVINHDSPNYIKSPEEWVAIEGSLEAIAKLNQLNIRVYIASNQSGIARNLFDYAMLNAIYRKMAEELRDVGGYISGFFFCPYLQGDCRKPNPGMLEEIETRTRIPVQNIPFIGDTMRDVEAARAIDATPILVRTGKGNDTLKTKMVPRDVAVFDDLAAAVNKLTHGM